MNTISGIVTSSERLEESAIMLSELAEVARETARTDDSFSKVCREHGIDWSKARLVLGSVSFRDLKLSGEKMPEPKKESCITYGYESLYADIFGISEEKVASYTIPPDVEETVEYIFSQFPDRAQDVLNRTYGLNGREPEDGESIAKAWSMTRERTRQIREKYIRVMRRPEYSELLRGGMELKRAKDAATEHLRNVKLQEIERLKSIGEKAALEEAKKLYIMADPLKRFQDEPIKVLNLSNRSFNCLMRGGVRTIGQLSERSEKELAKIPSMGKRSVSEVSHVLQAFTEFAETVFDDETTAHAIDRWNSMCRRLLYKNFAESKR